MSENDIRMSAELRGGCVHHLKRWSGDTHADLGGSVNEAGTEALMSAAADTIDRLTAERDVVQELLAIANDLVVYQTQIIQRLQALP